MANLLASPAMWRDLYANTPPAIWNGSAYVQSGSEGSFDGFYLRTNAGTEAGTVAGNVSFSNDDELPGFLVLASVSPFNIVDFIAITSGASSVPFNFDAPAHAGGYSLSISVASDDYSPADYYGLNVTITPSADPDPPDPPGPGECEELGRVTRCFVSGYDRTRIHEVRLVRGEKRCLVANFNGAIPKSRTIASATWRTNQYQSAVMSNARIFENDRSTAVDFLSGWWGVGLVKVDVTLDNGEVYNQVFRILSLQSPWFLGEQNPVSGPQVITVTV